MQTQGAQQVWPPDIRDPTETKVIGTWSTIHTGCTDKTLIVATVGTIRNHEMELVARKLIDRITPTL